MLIKQIATQFHPTITCSSKLAGRNETYACVAIWPYGTNPSLITEARRLLTENETPSNYGNCDAGTALRWIEGVECEVGK